MKRTIVPVAPGFRPPLDGGPIYDLLQGVEKAEALQAAHELGVFDLLAEDQREAAAVAAALGLQPRSSRSLLDALVSLGLLCKQGDRYANSALAGTFLVAGEPFYLGDLIQLMGKTHRRRCGRLPELLRQGAPASEGEAAVFDEGFIHAMAQGALVQGGLADLVEIVAGADAFRQAERMLDLGGGHGLYAVALTMRSPGLSAVVFDLPLVAPVARDFIRAYKADRVQVRAGDFRRDDIGYGYDLVLAADVFYRPADEVLPVLRKLHGALVPQGTLLVKHWYLDDTRCRPLAGAIFDFKLSLARSGGHVPTVGEAREMLRESGFATGEARLLSDNVSTLLTAIKTEGA